MCMYHGVCCLILNLLIRLILNYRNRKQDKLDNASDTSNISTEAHYNSSAQEATLSIAPKATSTEKQHKPVAAAAHNPIKPKTQPMSTSVPSMECHVNPSYDYVTKQQKTQPMSTSVPSMKCHVNPSYDYVTKQQKTQPMSTSVPSMKCHVNPSYDYVTKQQKTQPMSTSVPSMEFHVNPSYDYVSRQSYQKPTDQYNSDYETIDLIEHECKCSK